MSQTPYVTAKAGVLDFTRGLALEAAPYVTIKAICPGRIDTGRYLMIQPSLLIPEVREQTLRLIPRGRFGLPEDVAAAILFLASDQASYITGEEIDLNGGAYIA